MPVEPAAVYHQQLLLPQQVQRELLVVGDVEPLDVDLREDVERRLRLDGGDARNRVQRFGDVFALFVDATSGHDVIIDALMPAERGLHDRLRRHIRAQTHVGEHVETLDIVLGDALVAAQDHPADAVPGDHMRFRQSGERDAEQIRGHRRDGDVLKPVHDQTVVDLIGEDDELMLARDIDDLLQHLARVERAGRIVRIDDDDGLGPVGDLGAHVVHIRIPFGLLVAYVVHGGAAGQVHAGRPQWIVRRGHQHLVAGVEQRGHRQVDQFGDAVAGVDVVDRHIRQSLELGVLHNRLAGREQALGRRVALAVGELLAHVVHDLIGGAESERRRVADVQLQHAGAVGLHARGLVHHGASDVVEHVIELG